MRRTGNWVEVTQVGGGGDEPIWINLENTLMMRRLDDDDETVIWQRDDASGVSVKETPEAILAVPARVTVEETRRALAR